MNQLIEIWRKINLDEFPLKLQGDLIQDSHRFPYQSYAEFVDSENFGSNSSKFHLGLIPQPYIGNLANAKIILLMLNPGFSAGDYYAQENSGAFKEARIANLKQENLDASYPFFYLNPQFSWTAGGQWWQSKLASIARELAKHEKLAINPATAYREALSHISKHLACIELCPYFSKEYKQPKPELASMKFALDYVKTELAQRCQRDETAAVVLRKSSVWEIEKRKNVFHLESKHARGAHLTIETEAGDFIYKKLVSLLEEPAVQR